MIRWRRAAEGGTAKGEAIDAAATRGMADVLAALDNVIDDDAALGRVYAGLSVHGQAPCVDGGTTVPTARARGNAARRWRRALRPTAGLAAALAASAVALAMLGVPGEGHGGAGTSAADAAYVAKRVDGALRATGPGEIAQVTLHSGGTTTGEQWSYGGYQWRQVSYSSAGYPVEDTGSNGASVYTQVNYQSRTWSRGPLPDGGPVSASPAVLPGALGCGSTEPASVVSALRAAVSCGTLTEAGRQRVGGVDAIRLTGRNSKFSETIWVSPGTYLPLRVVTHMPSGILQEADITWLKPTAQNLARLTVPVPAGFRRVPLSAAFQQQPPGSGATAASPSAARRQPVSPAAPG